MTTTAAPPSFGVGDAVVFAKGPYRGTVGLVRWWHATTLPVPADEATAAAAPLTYTRYFYHCTLEDGRVARNTPEHYIERYVPAPPPPVWVGLDMRVPRAPQIVAMGAPGQALRDVAHDTRLATGRSVAGITWLRYGNTPWDGDGNPLEEVAHEDVYPERVHASPARRVTQQVPPPQA